MHFDFLGGWNDLEWCISVEDAEKKIKSLVEYDNRPVIKTKYSSI